METIPTIAIAEPSDDSAQDNNIPIGPPRDVTWISTSRLTSIAQPPPPPPLPPPPLPNIPRGISLVPSDELEAEYMTVDGDLDGVGGLPSPDWQALGPKKGPQRFVGGFVTGLKRLPRTMLKSRGGKRKPERKGTEDTAATWGTSGDTLPLYRSPTAVDAASPSHVPNVEGPQMPRAEPSGPAAASEVDSAEGPDRPRTPSAHSQLPARSGHSHFTDAQVEAQPAHDVPPPLGPFVPYEEATHEAGQTVPIHSASTESPYVVSPRPASDYDKMSTPIHSPSHTSLNSRVLKIGHFVKRVHALPWMTRRIASDYIPSEGFRAKYRKTAPGGTWYPERRGRKTSIDLLANFQQSSTSGRLRHHRHSRYRSHDQSLSPRRSRRRPHEGLHVYPDGYASGYIPQPLFIYAPTNAPHEPQPVYVIQSPPLPSDVIQPQEDFYPRAMSRAPTLHQ